MNAFLTGSRVYGTPRDDSDLDLVILCSPEDQQAIWGQADAEGLAGSANSIRYGRLNVIAFSDPAKFEAWRAGTEECKAKAPVTREQAVTCIQAHLAKLDAPMPEPDLESAFAS